MTALRQRVLAGARRLGVEPQLRRAQRALASPTARRDRRDRDHLHLLMALSLPADANCVDIGANVGEVLDEIVALAPRGRHVAFEPLPDLAARLTERFPGVDVRNLALSDEPGEATFHRVRGADARSGLSQLDHADEQVERFTVRTARLDEELDPDYAPALIKIDVEGAEALTLAGASGLLARHRPIVVLEHGDKACAHFGRSSVDVHRILAGAGLRVFDIDGGGPYDERAFAAITARGRLWTFVAHP